MRPLLTALLCLCAAAASASAAPTAAQWEAAGFGAPRLLPLSVDGADQALPPGGEKGRLALNFVLLRGSGWTEDMARADLARIAAVYAQCGIRITGASLIEADAPDGRTSFSLYGPEGGPDSLDAMVARVPLKDRPVFYLFHGFTDQEDDRAFSQADFTDGGGAHPALFDSVFLPMGVNSRKYADARRASPYSTAAHELLHVLTRFGQHVNVTPPNLMNIWVTRSDLILPGDCAQALKNPLVTR